MGKFPLVAIIGRPNTGKSTLFNRLVGERRAIVSDVAGTTRDQLSSIIETDEVDFLLIDTGGIGGGSSDEELEDNVTAQSLLALENADIILCTFNSKEELTSADQAVIEMLRKQKRSHVPIIVVPTKCDNPENTDYMSDYVSLGIDDEIIPVSATHNIGIDDLLNAVTAHLTKLHFAKQEEDENVDTPKVALVGRPNVGKSSLINALMSEPDRERGGRIVSDIPGTTRDTSDTLVRHEGHEYLFIDTAGLRRQSKRDSDIEHYSSLRSIQALERADIVVLVIDASEEISRQDKRLARFATEKGKAMILLLNKIDLLNKEQRAQKLQDIRRTLGYCAFAPIIPVSAETREQLPKLFSHFDTVQRNRLRRIATKDLQYWFQDAMQRLPARALAQGKHVTQADELPPTFVIFLKNPKMVQKTQLRFLERSLRERFAFDGTPVRFILKGPNQQ